MGFLVTLLYVALSHSSPAKMSPDLGDARIMLWFAIALLSITAFSARMFPYRAPQVWLMLGLVAAVPVSLLAHRSLAGAFTAFQEFLVSGIVFFLIVANVTTLARLRLLIIVFAGVCFFLLCRSVIAYHAGDLNSPYLLGQTESAPGILVRIRALGNLGDPNDFAQCLLTALPFLGLLWRPGRNLRNTLFVILPASLLLYGVFLTRSPSAVIVICVFLVLLFMNRLGRTRSIIAGVVLIALIMSPLSGSRETSLTSGDTALRTAQWTPGLAMLTGSPVFGAGYDTLLENGETSAAHNSFVQCFSELGLFGYFFWLGLLVYTIMDLNGAIAALRAKGENDQRYRYGLVLRQSLFVFLASSWFLSRTYTVTLYMLLGMVVAFVHVLNRGELTSFEPLGPSRWKLTVGLECATILIAYAFVRLHGGN